MIVLSQAQRRCQHMLDKVSTLPPGSGTGLTGSGTGSGITAQHSKDLQHNVVYLAEIVRNSVVASFTSAGGRAASSHTTRESIRKRWGDTAIGWLADEDVTLRTCAADMLVALTKRTTKRTGSFDPSSESTGMF